MPVLKVGTAHGCIGGELAHHRIGTGNSLDDSQHIGIAKNGWIGKLTLERQRDVIAPRPAIAAGALLARSRFMRLEKRRESCAPRFKRRAREMPGQQDKTVTVEILRKRIASALVVAGHLRLLVLRRANPGHGRHAWLSLIRQLRVRPENRMITMN